MLAVALALPAPAEAAIRALFVGVDRYRYSSAHVPTAEFNDLQGAVADVSHIKDALRTAYALDLDRPAGDCASANAVSITLTDDCATRARILAAFDDRLKVSARGDTLIFYFAGHGSQVIDDQVFDQASGANDTILPTDARAPGATEMAELLDSQIRVMIDGATAKGVNVVTIFDSCHSGTGARGVGGDGVDRFAPPMVVHGLRRPNARAASGPGGGYRVHFGGAADEEKAREVGATPPRAGVFTTALAATFVAMPNATFDDIAAEVRRKVEESGHGGQHPQAEGELRATMGGKARYAALLAAQPIDARHVSLTSAGRLSGITEGSTYALFASSTAALDDKAAPLAAGTVASVETSRAALKLDTAPAAPLPPRLIARETRHAFGSQRLRLRADGLSDGARKALAAILAGEPLATLGDPPQLIITPIGAQSGPVALYTADGTAIADLGDPRDPGFAATLHDALQKVSRVQTILGLRTDPGAAATTFCVDNAMDYEIKSCPPAGPAGRSIAVDRRAKLAIVNVADAPRFIYVFGIDDGYGVTLLLPRGGGVDPALASGQPVQTEIEPNSAGRYRFVTIATDAPIDAAALQQDRAGARDPGACRSALERALCAAAAGTRDPSAPKVGNWTATVTEVAVR